MQKMIEIEQGRSLNFKASAFSPIMYNRLFPGRDFLKDMDALKAAHEDKNDVFEMSDYEHFSRIAYLFAYQGLAPSPTQTGATRFVLHPMNASSPMVVRNFALPV